MVFVIVEGALIAFIVKYRRGKRPRTAEGPQIHGSTRLEVLWTVVPVLILAMIGTFVFWELPGIADAPKAAAADETTIEVEGHQFYWLFRYPNGAVSINQMVAPADEVVHERIVGLDWEVNHSWWVPDLGGKMDSIPGRVNTTWFKAPVGNYVARCAELCGIQHAQMDAVVNVVPARAVRQLHPAARWRTRSSADAGPGGVAGRLPVLPPSRPQVHRARARRATRCSATGRGSTTLLRNGRRQMPPVGKNWTAAQIDALVAYTKQFAKGGGA